MKKLIALFLLCCVTIGVTAKHRVEPVANFHHYAAVQGGTMEYVGKIGPYAVEFTYMNLHMGDGAHFMYRYTKIKVNKGEWIALRYTGKKGKYQVWKEYINGRNTGTFTILWTAQSIMGSFVNAKGKKYNVRATRGNDNWADAGDSPF